MRVRRLLESWIFSVSPDERDLARWLTQLTSSLRDLERKFDAVRSSVLYGEVPGAQMNLGARVERTSDLTIAHNTVTAVTWQAASGGVAAFDSGGFWSGSAPTVLRVPDDRAGLYVVTVGLNWAAFAGNLRQALINLNGVSVMRNAYVAGAGQQHQGCSTILSLVAGDEISASAYQNTGGDLDLLVANSTTHLAIGRLG